MALTNFAALTQEQKTAWSMDLWKQARNHSFINRFLGKGPNSLIQHITELKKSEKGARAVITLLADLEGDGVAGDRTLEGREEAIKTYDQVIRIDQLRHANHSKGRISEQKSIVDFRTNSRDVLAYWYADRMDQQAFLTLAGVPYSWTTTGVARVDSDLALLEYAADVTAPVGAQRDMYWDSANGLQSGNHANVGSGDVPKWSMFVEAKRIAKETYMRGIMNGGEENYHAFLCPRSMQLLKQDAEYRDNLRHAQTRGDDNALFTGTSVKIDGITLHEFRHVPQYTANGYGGGSGAAGAFVLFCGAQALGMADIGAPMWEEKDFDYGNQCGISVGKIMGFKKPVFHNMYTGGQADFGVMRIATSFA